MKFSVTVTLKKDVLDPQGKVVGQTLKNKKTHLSPLKRHFVKTYPVIAPMKVEKKTAGATILIEFQKYGLKKVSPAPYPLPPTYKSKHGTTQSKSMNPKISQTMETHILRSKLFWSDCFLAFEYYQQQPFL